MSKNMQFTIDDVIIPKPKSFKRAMTPNETNNITLNGTMYTDFISNRRSWIIGWELMRYEDYEIIEELYLSQYSEEKYLRMIFPAYGIDTMVKITIELQDIKFNSTLLGDFKMLISERNAIT